MNIREIIEALLEGKRITKRNYLNKEFHYFNPLTRKFMFVGCSGNETESSDIWYEGTGFYVLENLDSKREEIRRKYSEYATKQTDTSSLSVQQARDLFADFLFDNFELKK